MQAKPQNCIEQFNRGQLPNLLLLFGDEPQQKLDVLDAIRKACIEQGFSDRHQLIADKEFDWQQLVNSYNTMSLFSDKQLIELHLPDGKPGAKGAQILISLVEAENKDVILVIHGPQLNQASKNTKWFKSIATHGLLCQCYQLKGFQLQQYLLKIAEQKSLKINNEAISLLAEMNEGNLLAAKQEIQKLALIKPDHSEISLLHLKEILSSNAKYSVYEFIDTLLEGNIDKATTILFRLKEEGTEPNAIIWHMINELQRLQSCKLQLSEHGRINYSELRIWQNRQALYQSALARINDASMQKLQTYLVKVDHLLKTSVPENPFVLVAHLALLFLPLDIGDFDLI